MDDVWHRTGNAIFLTDEPPVDIFGVPFNTWFVDNFRIVDLVKFHSSDCPYARLFPVLRGFKKMVVKCGQALIGIFADVYILEYGWCDKTKETAYVLFFICRMLRQIRLLVERYNEHYPALSKMAFVPSALMDLFEILVDKKRFGYIQDGGFAVNVHDFLGLFEQNIDLVLESTAFNPIDLEPCILEYRQFVKAHIVALDTGTRVFRTEETDRDVVTADTFKLPDGAAGKLLSPLGTRSTKSGGGKGAARAPAAPKPKPGDGGGGGGRGFSAAAAAGSPDKEGRVKMKVSVKGMKKKLKLKIPERSVASISFAGVRKPASGSATESDSESGSQTSKRGRGRPPSKDRGSASESDTDSVKRGRGRPPRSMPSIPEPSRRSRLRPADSEDDAPMGGARKNPSRKART